MTSDLERAILRDHPPVPVRITVQFGDGPVFEETMAMGVSVSVVIMSADETGAGNVLAHTVRRTAGMPDHLAQYQDGHIALLTAEMQALADQANMRQRGILSWQLANKRPGQDGVGKRILTP